MAPITRALEATKPKRMTFSTPHPNVALQGSLARTRGAAPSQGDEGHSSLPSQACQYRPSRGVSHLAFKPLLRTSENSVPLRRSSQNFPSTHSGEYSDYKATKRIDSLPSISWRPPGWVTPPGTLRPSSEARFCPKEFTEQRANARYAAR